MPVKQLRIKLSNSLHTKFLTHLPGYGQRSRAVRRFIHIFCEECERFPLMASADFVDNAALQAAQDVLSPDEEKTCSVCGKVKWTGSSGDMIIGWAVDYCECNKKEE